MRNEKNQGIFIVIPAKAGIHFEIDLIKANGYLLSQV
jgi:hypothetical protein